MATTTITRATANPLDLPLLEPFVIATGQFLAANNVLVRVELEDGTFGLGEGSPSLSSDGETAATILAAARDMVALLPGRDCADWRSVATFLEKHFAAQSCARAAVEMALLDALTRHYGVPLYRWFGGASSAVETDMTVTIVPPERAFDLALGIAARGITTIKIKVGQEMAADEARVVAVHQAAPSAQIILDGNQGFDAPGALRLLAALERRGIVPALFEQPAHRDDWEGMASITARSPVLIAADEMVHSPADALRVVRERAAHAINIKLMKSTFLGALDIVGICRAARLQLMVGAFMESRLSTAAAVHFVAGMGGFRFVDLDTPMFIATDPFQGGYTQAGGRYDLSDSGPGHGVTQL